METSELARRLGEFVFQAAASKDLALVSLAVLEQDHKQQFHILVAAFNSAPNDGFEGVVEEWAFHFGRWVFIRARQAYPGRNNFPTPSVHLTTIS